MWIQSLGQEDPLEKGMQPTPVFLPGKAHGQRSLVGYHPRGHQDLDTTEPLGARARTHTHTHTHSHTLTHSHTHTLTHSHTHTTLTYAMGA